MRSSNGCWTCRLRRKKCDERRPICDVCAALHITCHFEQNVKPDWMDGGVKQEQMVDRIKKEIKESARRRREDPVWSDSLEATMPLTDPPGNRPAPTSNHIHTIPSIRNDATELFSDAHSFWLQYDSSIQSEEGSTPAFGQPDAVLFMFYIDTLLPFHYPFYRPSVLQGGRGWVLEMMKKPVVRQATLCQSVYFFSFAFGTRNICWDKVFTGTQNAFEVLRQALHTITGLCNAEELRSAIHIMFSILQLQRFEVSVVRFNNWQVHLNAALALFKRLLDGARAVEPKEAENCIGTLMGRLGSVKWTLFPSAEQATLSFSSSLAVFDDIIASTVLQEQPKLYEYHRSLLCGDGTNNKDTEPAVNIETVLGVKNWVLLYIGETAALDAWKHQRKAAGNLDVMELAQRAVAVKDSLTAHLTHLEAETDVSNVSNHHISLMDVPDLCNCQPDRVPARQSSFVTKVWAHASLLYLSVVVSGWQPASVDVRHHVDRILELLKQMSSPALLRTMVWPFCVAGCFAESSQESRFRAMVEPLEPQVFGTVHKSLKIMECVWRDRYVDIANRDLATCFRNQGDLALLL